MTRKTAASLSQLPFWTRHLTLLRESTGLSQADFAAELGLNQSTYAYYEIGREPPLKVILKICDYFSITVDYFLRGKAAVGPHTAARKSFDYSQASPAERKRYLATVLKALESHEDRARPGTQRLPRPRGLPTSSGAKK